MLAELQEWDLAEAFQPNVLLALSTLGQGHFFLPLSSTKFWVTQLMDLDGPQGSFFAQGCPWALCRLEESHLLP